MTATQESRRRTSHFYVFLLAVNVIGLGAAYVVFRRYDGVNEFDVEAEVADQVGPVGPALAPAG